MCNYTQNSDYLPRIRIVQVADVELYSILDRVSCWCCQNKNLRELRNMYLYLPQYWKMLKGLQSRIDIPMKGEGRSVFQLEERFKKEVKQRE